MTNQVEKLKWVIGTWRENWKRKNGNEEFYVEREKVKAFFCFQSMETTELKDTVYKSMVLEASWYKSIKTRMRSIFFRSVFSCSIFCLISNIYLKNCKDYYILVKDTSYYFIILNLYSWTQLKSYLGGTEDETEKHRNLLSGITGRNWLILCKLCFSAHCSASSSTLTLCLGSVYSTSGARLRYTVTDCAYPSSLILDINVKCVYVLAKYFIEYMYS